MSASYAVPDAWGDPGDLGSDVGDLASRVSSHQRLVLTANGKPFAALVPLHDLDDLEAIDRADIAEAEAAIERDEWIPHAEVMRMLGFDDLADVE